MWASQGCYKLTVSIEIGDTFEAQLWTLCLELIFRLLLLFLSELTVSK